MGGRSDDHYYHAIDRAGRASDRHDGPDASGANARYTVDHAARNSFADPIPTCAMCIANGLARGAAKLSLIVWLRDMSGFALIGVLSWFGMRMVMAAGETITYLHPIDVSDNLNARRIHTQVRVLTRIVMAIVGLIGLSSILMLFPAVHRIGATLLASAGVVGLAAGIAARPVLGNLIAGLQIALTQPIRLDDVVIVAEEWGRVEEIHSSYVVVRLWDQRRLIVPLQWFIENPFQNWTRTNAQIIGSIFLWVDYRLPLEPLRDELVRLCNAAPEWDHRAQVLQVTDTSERAMQLRVLVSSANSALNWDLRCKIREGLIEFIQRHYPSYLPHMRIHTQEQGSAIGSPTC